MMNSMIRSALRVSTMRAFTPLGRRDFARTFWHMSKPENISGTSIVTLKKPSIACDCGCGSKNVHTQGETDLVEFLKVEIEDEKRSGNFKNVPTSIDGFNVKLNGSEVELSKETDKEKIIVSFNINHTVDTDEGHEEMDVQMDDKPMAEMKSLPNFEVDIVRGGKTLSFTCSFFKGVPTEDETNDEFGIDEVTLFEGEWTDKNYSVAGEVLDGYFYDVLMNFLDEKGISNEFASKLSTLSTNYEHASYIGFLESLSKFTLSGKKG